MFIKPFCLLLILNKCSLSIAQDVPHKFLASILTNNHLIGGGAIIGRRWVFTTLQLISREIEYDVVPGLKVIGQKEPNRVESVYRHFTQETVALLKTQARFEFNSWLQPITFNETSNELKGNLIVYDPKVFDRTVKLDIASEKEVKSYINSPNLKDMFCALTDEGRSSNETGSPFVIGHALIGTYNNLFYWGKHNKRGLACFDYVPSYKEWIEYTIRTWS